MEVSVTKLTDLKLAQRACQFTLHSQNATSIPLDKLYKCEHSPLRTQMFWVELKGIPSFVSVHLTRHKIGVEHFVQTMRDDRGAGEVADRNTPVNHAMLVNAQALINMSRKRLCKKASPETRRVMQQIMHMVEEVDHDLYLYMVPDCMYRNGCYETASCGWYYG